MLHKTAYINKIEEFLQTQNITITKNKNPMQYMINKIKNNTKLYEDVMKEFGVPSPIMNINPAVPRLYGQIKIYKIGHPIRPFLSYTKTSA